MKKTLIASFSALLILVSSCKTKTGDQKANIIQSLDHVAIVANVNVRAIMEKGKFLENIPELGMAMAFSPIKINDSTNTGFDPISNKIIAVNTNPESGEGDVIMLFDILDKTKFRATLDKQIPMKLEEREKDGFTILKFSESGNGAALVYNDKMGFITSQFNINNEEMNAIDTRVDELIGFASAPKKAELDDKITEVLSAKNDFGMAYYQKNAQSLMEKIQKLSSQSSNAIIDDELKAKIEKASALITLNGVNGEIVLNTVNTGYEDFKGTKYDMLGSKGVQEEMLSYLALNSKNILGLMSLNFDMKKTLELLKQDENFSTGDLDERLLDFFTGEVSGALSKADNEEEDPIFSLVAVVQNETELIAMMDTIKEMTKITPNFWAIQTQSNDLEEEYDWMGEEEKEFFMGTEEVKPSKSVYLAVKNGKLFFSNDSTYTSKSALGEGSSAVELTNFDIKEATANPVYFFMNVDANNYPAEMKGFIEKLELAKGSASWNGTDFRITFKDKAINGWDALIKSIMSSKNMIM